MGDVIAKKRLPSGAGLGLASLFLEGMFGDFLPRLSLSLGQRVEDA
jgi:hypothetical protein